MARTSTRSPLGVFFAKSLKMARSRDKMKGWEADPRVTVEYLIGLYHGQNGKCCHTGETMGLTRGKVDGAVRFELCTMEREYNWKGYEFGNIMLACDGINRMRGDMELSQFRNYCKRIGLRA